MARAVRIVSYTTKTRPEIKDPLLLFGAYSLPHALISRLSAPPPDLPYLAALGSDRNDHYLLGDLLFLQSQSFLQNCIACLQLLQAHAVTASDIYLHCNLTKGVHAHLHIGQLHTRLQHAVQLIDCPDHKQVLHKLHKNDVTA